MRFKIPCKKYRLSGLTGLVMAMLLATAPAAVQAEVFQQADHGLFWSIQKDGKPAGYLLGTIHSEDPRVLDFSEDFIRRLNENDIFAMELVPDLPTLARLAEYMHYPQGQTLESVIGAERFDQLVSALSTYGIPAEFISRMKPWAAMMTLSTPPPKTGFFMDLSLSLRASGSGLKVVGLETLEQQLSFLEEMPLSMQLSLLDQAIDACGGVQGELGKLITGGPMMGLSQYTDQVPVTKGTSGILLLAKDEVITADPGPCIRCGRCSRACRVEAGRPTRRC